MNTTLILIKRNVKLFFKDKGMFFYFPDNACYITRLVWNVFGKYISR